MPTTFPSIPSRRPLSEGPQLAGFNPQDPLHLERMVTWAQGALAKKGLTPETRRLAKSVVRRARLLGKYEASRRAASQGRAQAVSNQAVAQAAQPQGPSVRRLPRPSIPGESDL